jgi:hypothetical protein
MQEYEEVPVWYIGIYRPISCTGVSNQNVNDGHWAFIWGCKVNISWGEGVIMFCLSNIIAWSYSTCVKVVKFSNAMIKLFRLLIYIS